MVSCSPRISHTQGFSPVTSDIPDHSSTISHVPSRFVHFGWSDFGTGAAEAHPATSRTANEWTTQRVIANLRCGSIRLRPLEAVEPSVRPLGHVSRTRGVHLAEPDDQFVGRH